MSDSRAIGVFDSGLGGLTVVHELIEALPNESFIYLGDTLRCPYGSRSVEAIRKFSRQITKFLVEKDVKMIVVACNTVSAVALDAIKEVAHKIPVLGVVEPGSKAAVNSSPDKTIGVIGTKTTVSNSAYKNGIHKIDNSIKVYEKACPLLVPLVEEGWVDHKATELIVEDYLDDLIDFGIDTLVLGCTHYPLLLKPIEAVVGGRIQIIDSAWWTAKEVKRILNEKGITSETVGENENHFYTTDMTDSFYELASRFLRGKLGKLEEVQL